MPLEPAFAPARVDPHPVFAQLLRDQLLTFSHRVDRCLLHSQVPIPQCNAYIQGGDFEIPDRPKVGLPGARFELDQKGGR